MNLRNLLNTRFGMAGRPSPVWPLSLLTAVLAIFLAGCATSSSSSTSTTLLMVGGEPGVTVRIQSTAPGIPEVVATVPAKLSFHGGSYDLRCVHGPEPGRLSLLAQRGGMSISTGDTTRPGEVTVFKIRPTEISVRMEPLSR